MTKPPRRTKREYEKVFEDLMQYTDFTNVNQINSKEDLRDFFGQVKQDSNSKGKTFKLAKTFVFEMSEAFHRLTGKRKKTIQTRKQQVLASRKAFTNFEQAEKELQVTTNEDNKAVYRSKITIKGKTHFRWRDNKGHFAKPPKTKEQIPKEKIFPTKI